MPRLTNNFRLNEADGLTGNRCLNGGSTLDREEQESNFRKPIWTILTVSKTARLISGAYEGGNTANIAAQERKTARVR